MWLIMVAESKLHFSADLKLTFFVCVCVCVCLLEKQLAVLFFFFSSILLNLINGGLFLYVFAGLRL